MPIRPPPRRPQTPQIQHIRHDLHGDVRAPHADIRAEPRDDDFRQPEPGVHGRQLREDDLRGGRDDSGRGDGGRELRGGGVVFVREEVRDEAAEDGAEGFPVGEEEPVGPGEVVGF